MVKFTTNSYETFAVCDPPGGGPLDEISIKTETIPSGFTLARNPSNADPRFEVLGRGVYISPPPNTPSMTITITDTNSGDKRCIRVTSSGETGEITCP